jgi:hypothetical protein
LQKIAKDNENKRIVKNKKKSQRIIKNKKDHKDNKK